MTPYRAVWGRIRYVKALGITQPTVLLGVNRQIFLAKDAGNSYLETLPENPSLSMRIWTYLLRLLGLSRSSRRVKERLKKKPILSLLGKEDRLR